jgi:hypothetical protein
MFHLVHSVFTFHSPIYVSSILSNAHRFIHSVLHFHRFSLRWGEVCRVDGVPIGCAFGRLGLQNPIQTGLPFEKRKTS